jgi:hypothetical protein
MLLQETEEDGPRPATEDVAAATAAHLEQQRADAMRGGGGLEGALGLLLRRRADIWIWDGRNIAGVFLSIVVRIASFGQQKRAERFGRACTAVDPVAAGIRTKLCTLAARTALPPRSPQISLLTSIDRECGASMYLVLFAVLLEFSEWPGGR